MKKNLIYIILLGILLASCTSAPFSTSVDGYSISNTADLELLEKNIKLALVKYNWRIYDESPGKISAEYVKNEGIIMVRIEVIYDQSGYSINYLESKNLDENMRRMTIHKNYNRWIANLNKTIYEGFTLDS
ncbi:MAG: hypothetical protein PF447_13950 [Spirochaetaceae bacterium]|nr:hypothetical protein [Spirochaetaceae bacterium]